MEEIDIVMKKHIQESAERLRMKLRYLEEKWH